MPKKAEFKPFEVQIVQHCRYYAVVTVLAKDEKDAERRLEAAGEYGWNEPAPDEIWDCIVDSEEINALGPGKLEDVIDPELYEDLDITTLSPQ